MNGWEEVKLGEIAKINPTEKLSKGQIATKIGMEHLQPFTKKPSGQSQEAFNGGMKFKNGDTLIARITPCLENGKTAYIDILKDDEIGFGSTEYIVLREIPKISDKQFLYYFSRSNVFRDVAIASMTGSSGRQRVQTDVVVNHLFNIPPLPEQQAIASVLSSLDDKIDLLHRQNKTLEAMAETLFRQWFIEEAKDDWEEGNLTQLITLKSGFAFKSKDFRQFGENRIIKIKNISNSIIDINNTDYINDEVAIKISDSFKLKKGNILIAMTGAEIGKLGIIPKTNKNLFLNQRVGLLNPKFEGADIIAYLYLKSDIGQDYIYNTATGSAQPNISGTGIENCSFPKIHIKILKKYGRDLGAYFNKVIENLGQIQTLENLRDTLLPKLMSGEIRVQH